MTVTAQARKSGHQRRQNERDLVAHATGRVLVGARTPELAPVEHVAGVEQRAGERVGLALVEPVQERRHQPGAGLIVGDLATHVPRDECGDLLRLVRPAVALGAQESASVHHRDQ